MVELTASDLEGVLLAAQSVSIAQDPSRRRWSGLRARRLDANADPKTRLAKARVVSEHHQRTVVDRQRAREMNRIETPDVIKFARDVDHDGADRNHINTRKQGCGNTNRRRIESPCCLK